MRAQRFLALSTVIVLTTLCLFVVQLPADTVYGRVLPALGIAPRRCIVNSVTIDRFALCGVHGMPARSAIFATRSVRERPPM